MPFKGVMCWSPERVQSVMTGDATQPNRALFLATHHPMTMYREVSSNQVAGNRTAMTEKEFLSEFMCQSDFAFVTVLGNSGRGKSHLIRWLDFNIERTPQRRVLYIPKVRTNLRDIIDQILDEVPGEAFDRYRARLSSSTNSLSREQAREHLLAQLAIAVGPNGQSHPPNMSEAQEHIRDHLPHLLHDPFFRREFLKPHGFIDRLVDHILGRKATVEDVDARRSFELTDLPINLRDIDKASLDARDFYGFLVSVKELQHETVAWLNSHLDEAIRKVLNLGQDDLLRLMREVREALARDGVELILLIEDFAKLQGIDLQLLEAILVRSNQPGDPPLCAMRTAIACTTGYYRGLEDTVRQRMTFSVTLDLGNVDDTSLVTPKDLQALASRYLNAVRVSEDQLSNWALDIDNHSPPNRCNTCEHVDACHVGFGAVDGVGLYPFSPIALTRISNRLLKGAYQPRLFIKEVLRYTLVEYGRDIPDGRFPSSTLHKHFGSGLDLGLDGLIDQHDSQNRDRRKALLDLWSDGRTFHNLAPSIHEAFQLPSLDLKSQPVPLPKPINAPTGAPTGVIAPKPSKPQPPVVSSSLPEALIQDLKSLNDWANGQVKLPQSLGQTIRVALMERIRQRIDWPSEFMVASRFISTSQATAAGDKVAFRQRSIQFRDSGGAGTPVAPRPLLIPIQEDQLKRSARALRGLLLHQYHGHWRFDEGPLLLRDYAWFIEQCADEVLDISLSSATNRDSTVDPSATWSPVPALVEVLATGNRLFGIPDTDTPTMAEMVDALFKAPPSVATAGRAPGYIKLQEQFIKVQKDALDQLGWRIFAIKGNASDSHMIDAAALLPALQKVQSLWCPSDTWPEDVRSDLKASSTFHAMLKAALRPALEAERSIHAAWLTDVSDCLGGHRDATEIATVFEELAEKAVHTGFFVGIKPVDLEQSLATFRKVPVAQLLDTATAIEKEESYARLFARILASPPQKRLEVSSCIQLVDKLVIESAKELDDRWSLVELQGGLDIQQAHTGIRTALTHMLSLIDDLKVSNDSDK
jgi:hypothetical protein